MPVGVLDGSVNPATPTLLYVHPDHLNRPVLMTNTAKSVVWRASYEPFGAVHQITGPAANDNRFPGQLFQLESGLAYNWHRHYDASIGRYTQADPLGLTAMLSDGPSVYGYAKNMPLELTDPTGQFGIVGAGLGAGLSLGLQAAGNWWRGCDVFNYQNYDWWDVGVSAAAGALGPSALGAARDAFNSAKRMGDLSSKMSKLKPGSGYHDRLGKKYQTELSKTADSLTFVGATQVLSAVAKSGNGNGGKSCNCR